MDDEQYRKERLHMLEAENKMNQIIESRIEETERDFSDWSVEAVIRELDGKWGVIERESKSRKGVDTHALSGLFNPLYVINTLLRQDDFAGTFQELKDFDEDMHKKLLRMLSF